METKNNSGMDLLISFDTTGSMYPVLAQVRQNVTSFVKDMFKSIEDIRVGVIAHGDYCDKDNPYTIRVMDLTDDQSKICEFIKTTDKTFGGDVDECYELVMHTARTAVNWGAGRTKVFVMIGDASPHGVNYPDNKDRIDWKNEAGLLNELGVKMFAVHALSYYRSSSRNFYQTIADMTGGTYLTLDQFDEVIDLIKATCIAEYSEEKLNEFVSIIKSNGRMTRTMAKNINRLSGIEIEVETKGVQADGLVAVKPGRFQIMEVPNNCVIKEFVESNGIEFKQGRGFYELTKHETIQQYKEVIIQDRATGEMFTGAQVREKLGLKPQSRSGGVKESLSSRDTAIYRVFVQSTSYNRKLIGGTTFLYEISDIEDTGTVVGDEVVVDADRLEVEETKEEKKALKKMTKKVSKAEEKRAKEALEDKKAALIREELDKAAKKVVLDLDAKVEEHLKRHLDEPAPVRYRGDIIPIEVKTTKKAKVPTVRTMNKHSKAVKNAFDRLDKVLNSDVTYTELMETNGEVVKALEGALKYFKSFK